MKAPPDPLAREITRRESLQSYMTMRLLVDRDLVEDSFRAYAYFRWADDVVDRLASSDLNRREFIHRQRRLVNQLYRGVRPSDMLREEKMVADLVQNDRGPNSLLRSYIENFLSIIEFDSERKGRRITAKELQEYSDRLALAVTDAIQHFINNGHAYPVDEHRIAAARAAHVTHMLRDLRADLATGYWNIPSEYLEKYGIGPEDIDNPDFLNWVRSRVEEARTDFRLGKSYINNLDSLRTKIAAMWYCGRFERVLGIIERDGYSLRLSYSTHHQLIAWLGMVWIASRVSIRHASSRIGKAVHFIAEETRALGGLGVDRSRSPSEIRHWKS